MEKVLLLFLTLTSQIAFTQNSYHTYLSLRYSYSIEYSSSFAKQSIIGKNIDFKVADREGNSIIVVVKKLLTQEEDMTITDILNIPSSSWEANVQLPNVKVIKKGEVSVDSRKGMFLHYTSKDIDSPMTLYHTNYFFLFEGYLYNLSATCDINDISKMQPIFFRALQSFTFPD
jgi:hypothetical protein